MSIFKCRVCDSLDFEPPGLRCSKCKKQWTIKQLVEAYKVPVYKTNNKKVKVVNDREKRT